MGLTSFWKPFPLCFPQTLCPERWVGIEVENVGSGARLPAFESSPLPSRRLLSPLYKVGRITVPPSWGCYEDGRSLCAKSLEAYLAHRRF